VITLPMMLRACVCVCVVWVVGRVKFAVNNQSVLHADAARSDGVFRSERKACHHHGGAARRSRRMPRSAANRVSMPLGRPNVEATSAHGMRALLRCHRLRAMRMLIMGCSRS
jgi:hypothetical protein